MYVKIVKFQKWQKKKNKKKKGINLIFPSKSYWKIEIYRLGLVVFPREKRNGEVEPESAGNVIEMNVGDAIVVFLFSMICLFDW